MEEEQRKDLRQKIGEVEQGLNNTKQVIGEKAEAVLSSGKQIFEEKAEEVLEKAIEKKKVGMFRGIQSRIVTLIVCAVVFSAVALTLNGIDAYSKGLKDRIRDDMTIGVIGIWTT